MIRSQSSKLRRWRRNRSGMSLVIVLGSLVLLSALVLAFLASVGTELKSSKVYAEGASVRLLAQSAVNIVTAEIREATKSTDSTGALGTWASQPGMIRTYRNNGQPDRYFKLYSDTVMTGTGTFDPTAPGEAVPSTWHSDKAIFTDLNQPVTVGGADQYPILDGNNLRAIDGMKTYDADGNGLPDVQGFHVKSTAPLATAGVVNPVPMPVRWLYVLANGEVVAPTGSGMTATVAGASRTNPIVGRLAFWADDETSKVNINTASEGTYWDTPRVASETDIGMAVRQPAQHEYQRYPGHPAMTSLSTIFAKPAGYTDAAWAEEIYNIVPRVKGGTGSSLGGTVNGSSTLEPDADRLYATADELLFKPTLTSGSRQENESSINKAALERAKFFITASSRAPDLNLFSKPRVCIWPIYKDEEPAHTTAFDRLIAFCSKANRSIYYLQRENPLSPTHDLPSGGAPTGLGRNRTLLEYLRGLTSPNIPGFGGNFAAKYGAKDRDQILTQIFDYVRSTNMLDQSTSAQFTPNNRPGAGQVIPIEDTATGTRGFGRFPTLQGVTLIFIGVSDAAHPWNPGGMPPPPANQIAVQAWLVPQFFDPSQGYPYNWPDYQLTLSGLDNLVWSGVDASGALLPEQPIFNGSATINVRGVYGSSWKSPTLIIGDRAAGGSVGAFEVAANRIWSPHRYPFITPSTQRVNMIHPHPPAPTPQPAVPPTFPFKSNGPITVRISAPDGTLLQSIQLEFPSPHDFPVPDLAPPSLAGNDFRRLTDLSNGRTAGRADWVGACWITAKDVVRAIVPAVGDLRMVMPRKVITAAESKDFFGPHSRYADSSQRWAHNLRSSTNVPYHKATAGRLLPLNYRFWPASGQYENNPEAGGHMNTKWATDSSVVPDTFTTGVALGKNAAAAAGDLPGDWDNGVGFVPDGPYINKADEGDYAAPGSSGSQYAYFGWSNVQVGATLFSPNRMVPSAGMFGSLPTGVWANRPWQTLLFRPGPAGHPGLDSPRDHLLLDLFHMPVVEPYAISEPLSTAGRINMNYQIVPFTYINRDTGVRAVLKSEKVTAISDSRAHDYKQLYTNANTGPFTQEVRFAVNVDETLKGFAGRFDNEKDLFRSATEICDIHIVPAGATYAGMPTYWNSRRLTGDNSRERPYTTLYPRLTTKSNTYTVHVRVQSLKKLPSTNPGQWVEGVDLVTGEYRGAQTVERFVDPNDPALPDFATSNALIDPFYKFRVVNSKQFAP